MNDSTTGNAGNPDQDAQPPGNGITTPLDDDVSTSTDDADRDDSESGAAGPE